MLSHYYNGYAKFKLTNYSEAKIAYENAIRYGESIASKNILPTIYIEYARILNKTGDNEKAKDFALKGLKSAKSIRNHEYTSIAQNLLIDIYDNLNKKDSAIKFAKDYGFYADSAYKNDARVLTAKNELDNAEKEFKRKKEAQERRIRNIIIISVVSLIALILIIYLIYKQYRLKQKYNKELQTHIELKDRFFRIISHDLKGPLSSFDMLLKQIIDNYDDLEKETLLEYIKNIDGSVEKINDLLLNLLQWAKLQIGEELAKMDVFDINKLIKERIALYETAAKQKNIEIISNLSDNIALVYADKNMIDTVLRNLINNAIKFTKKNGNIEIRTSMNLDKCFVYIKDNGIGIKQEDEALLFRIDEKISRRGTNNEKGTGLGLIICKEFLDLNNGEISFETKYGEGTEFYFDLPMSTKKK
jgi:signal transduction histidine kinase